MAVLTIAVYGTHTAVYRPDLGHHTKCDPGLLGRGRGEQPAIPDWTQQKITLAISLRGIAYAVLAAGSGGHRPVGPRQKWTATLTQRARRFITSAPSGEPRYTVPPLPRWPDGIGDAASEGPA